MVIDWLPLLLFIAVWIAFLEGKFKRAIIKKAKSLNYPLTIAVFLVVAFLLDMRYMYWISYIRDPIEWDLATPVQFHADGTPGIVYADKFYISGTARKKVVLSAASVVSSKSNLSLILLAGVDSRTGEVSGLNEIPEGAKFSLYNDIPAQGQKMTSNQFLVEWPQFTFVFESNGKRYEYPVDKDLVDKMIHEKELAYRPPILPTVSWKRP